MSKDPLFEFAASMDWITSLSDLIAGYNTVEYEGWDSDCRQVEKELKKQGIKCRTQFNGDGWRVISKR